MALLYTAGRVKSYRGNIYALTDKAILLNDRCDPPMELPEVAKIAQTVTEYSDQWEETRP